MTDYPVIKDPEPWQQTETVYGRESALIRRTLDRVRYKPQAMEMRFVLPNTVSGHTSAAYREPLWWETIVQEYRTAIDGKRLRICIKVEAGGGQTFPLRRDATYAGPLYYEGIISVGAVQSSGTRGELGISAEIDPWVTSAAISETVTLSSVYTKESPKTWQKSGRGMPFVPAFEVHTAREDGAVPTSNRIYVRIAGGTWYPLYFISNGTYVDSDYAGSSFVATEGEVDWDNENKRFIVLPISFPSDGALQLEFAGKGSVAVHWKVGERV